VIAPSETSDDGMQPNGCMQITICDFLCSTTWLSLPISGKQRHVQSFAVLQFLRDPAALRHSKSPRMLTIRPQLQLWALLFSRAAE
jgi:hypothetical protein